jgi:uncharacterized protein (TIGR02246 family)
MRMLAIALVLSITIGARPNVASGPEQILDAFVAAFNARDAARVASLYAQEAELMPPDGAPVKGRAAIEAAFRTQFNHVQIVDIHSMTSGMSGPLAYLVGQLTLSTKTSQHGADIAGGNYLVVLRLEAGEWKIAYHMFTLPLRPEFVG